MEQICAYITALEKRIENTEKENEQLRKFKEEVETKAKAETKAKEEAETKAKEEAETKDLEDDFDLSAVVYADNAKYNRELIKPIFEYLRAKIFSKTEGYIQAFQNNIKCFEVSFIEDCLNKFGKKSVIGVLIEDRLRKNKYFALEMLASDKFYFDVLFICL
jgi:ribosomal protein L17